MTVTDWLTIIAIILGPLFGVVLAIWLEDQRAKRERRLNIFRTLMRTRRTPTSPDHVGALNLVEIEFGGHQDIIQKWKKLFEHFAVEPPRRTDEQIRDNMLARTGRAR